MDISLIYRSVKKPIIWASRVIFLFAVIFVILALFFTLTSPDRTAAAKKSSANKKQIDKYHHNLYAIINGEENSVDKTEKMRAEFVAALMCSATGDFCTPNPNEKFYNESWSYKIAQVFSTPFATPPASGVMWVASSLQNSGFIPKTYAQGIGFSSLTSFQSVWKAMRDVVYLAMVLIIVVIGFMIMFNISFGSKNGVTVEAMLPRFVITLLLISFSYAIAGFLIDLMYVVMYMTVAVFTPLIGDVGEMKEILGSVSSGQPADLFWLVWGRSVPGDVWDMSQSLYSVVPAFVRYFIDAIVFTVFAKALMSAVGIIPGMESRVVPKFKPAVTSIKEWGSKIANSNVKIDKVLHGFGSAMGANSSILKPIFSKIGSIQDGTNQLKNTPSNVQAATFGVDLSFVIGYMLQIFIIEPLMAAMRVYATYLLIFLMIIVSLLFVFVRIFFMLFGAYIEIILAVMFAPFYIMFNALPGNNAFVDWLKNLAINLLSFPLVVGIMLVSSYLLNFSETEAMWVPPFITSITSQRAVQILVAGAILFNTPGLILQIKEYLGYKKGFSLSPLAMVAPILTAVAGVGGVATQASSIGKAAKTMGGPSGILKGLGMKGMEDK